MARGAGGGGARRPEADGACPRWLPRRCLLGGRAASVLLDVEALVGAVTGAKTPATRGGAAATTLCAITELGTGVLFNAATDAVTSARIRYIAQPGVAGHCVNAAG